MAVVDRLPCRCESSNSAPILAEGPRNEGLTSVWEMHPTCVDTRHDPWYRHSLGLLQFVESCFKELKLVSQTESVSSFE